LLKLWRSLPTTSGSMTILWRSNLTKARFTEFLQESRKLFPDTALEVLSVLESGDYAFARWRLTGIQTVGHGLMRYRIPIDLPGTRRRLGSLSFKRSSQVGERTSVVGHTI